jgi:hypothetical protein
MKKTAFLPLDTKALFGYHNTRPKSLSYGESSKSLWKVCRAGFLKALTQLQTIVESIHFLSAFLEKEV